ncbi:LysR family transcriptional regulator [Streptomyces sp. NPDC018321]|uniref:helix-turn-helix domain-containing protein n=1 Tax=unclassified Streptomyces TaxID=2593676 RepID=UPI0037B312B1
MAPGGCSTGAARHELIVQSALSTSVRNLERELGADLFDRTGRRVVLTEAGRVAIGTIRTLTCLPGELDLACLVPDAGAPPEGLTRTRCAHSSSL